MAVTIEIPTGPVRSIRTVDPPAIPAHSNRSRASSPISLPTNGRDSAIVMSVLMYSTPLLPQLTTIEEESATAAADTNQDCASSATTGGTVCHIILRPPLACSPKFCDQSESERRNGTRGVSVVGTTSSGGTAGASSAAQTRPSPDSVGSR